MPIDLTSPPAGLRLSKAQLDRLPKPERDSAVAVLWQKSGGICALCEAPLPDDAANIEPDHRDPIKAGTGGPDELANLYFAHRRCNRSRQNLPFPLGVQVVRYQVWAENKPHVTFDDVVARFVQEGGQKIQYALDTDHVTLLIGGDDRRYPLFKDPATSTPYFFAEVPVAFVQNDADTQPRFIETDHVRELAIDFQENPVHEPSNCRLVQSAPGVASLLQFDGQHKTTAQIIIGRTLIPMKVYIEPDKVMIQRLVLQIQQGIKKRPLTTSDTLRKLKDVLRDRLDRFSPPAGSPKSEKAFIESLPLEDQREVRKQLITDIESLVLFDSPLYPLASKKKDTKHPYTDKVLLAKLVKPLVCDALLTSDMTNPVGYERDYERTAIHLIHAELHQQLLAGRWGPNAAAIDQRRAQNFFYQGSLGWSITMVLLPALKTLLNVPQSEKERMFLRPLSDVDKERVKLAVRKLCAWPVWSTNDPIHLAAMRSHTVSSVAAVFSNYSDVKLAHDVVG